MYQPPQQSPYSSYYGWQPAPPPPPQKPSRAPFYLAMGLVALILFLLIAYSGAFNSLIQAIEPSCTIGLTGTAATITIEAWSANQDCDAFFAGNPTFLGPAVENPTKNYYRYSGTPTEPVVCEGNDQGRHIIVRDEGALKLVGNSICSSMPLTT